MTAWLAGFPQVASRSWHGTNKRNGSQLSGDRPPHGEEQYHVQHSLRNRLALIRGLHPLIGGTPSNDPGNGEQPRTLWWTGKGYKGSKGNGVATR